MQPICIFSGDNHQEALTVKQLLESNGIQAMMPTEHMSGIAPHMSFAIGGFTVLVSPVSFLKAAEILSSYNFKITNRELIENLEEISKRTELTICPKCETKALETIRKKRSAFVLSVSRLFGRKTNEYKTTKFCHFCGEKS